MFFVGEPVSTSPEHALGFQVSSNAKRSVPIELYYNHAAERL
jgi:hypothetical protein